MLRIASEEDKDTDGELRSLRFSWSVSGCSAAVALQYGIDHHAQVAMMRKERSQFCPVQGFYGRDHVPNANTNK